MCSSNRIAAAARFVSLPFECNCTEKAEQSDKLSLQREKYSMFSYCSRLEIDSTPDVMWTISYEKTTLTTTNKSGAMLMSSMNKPLL